MNQDLQIEIESKILLPDFYRQNFPNNQVAADYLGISLANWNLFLEEIKESQSRFIYTMRIEDVLEHLSQINPYASLGELALRYGFRSRLHLLWHFYKRHRCTPRRWIIEMGIIMD